MNRTTLREVALPLASLAVLVAVGWLAYARITGNRVSPLTPSNLVSENGRTNLGADEASSILPGNLPLPDDAEITQSFEVAQDGEFQGTRAYESSRSITEELNAYVNYLETGSWTVVDRAEGTGYSAILAEREGRQLLASFSAAASGKTSVTVTSVAAPAKY